MYKNIYNNLINNISKSVKSALNEAEEFKPLKDDVVLSKGESLITKCIGNSSEIEDKLLITEPFKFNNKGIVKNLMIFKTSGEYKSILGVFYAYVLETKKASITLYNIAGDKVNINSSKVIVENSGKKIAKMFTTLNQSAIQDFKKFMYNNGYQQFNWNTFINKLNNKDNISPEIKAAATKLYKDLVRANKSYSLFAGMLEIINPDGDMEYEGVKVNDLLPIIKEMYAKAKIK